jgi:hypothetical protein
MIADTTQAHARHVPVCRPAGRLKRVREAMLTLDMKAMVETFSGEG